MIDQQKVDQLKKEMSDVINKYPGFKCFIYEETLTLDSFIRGTYKQNNGVI